MKTCPTCRGRYPDALEFCPQDGTALPAGAHGKTQALYDKLLGTVVDGRYKIEAKLGEGGMGFVYAARHVIIDKRVAIKVLKKEAQSEETAGQRFIQEARAASKIGQANIVDITDFGTLPDGSAYFVMEFLEGQTLGQLIEDGPLAPRRALSIAAQVARGLAAAHKHSVVHRDLKPENIFLVERDGQRDQVKIVDFGIAKVQTQHASARLTQAGMVLGTPEYMAPEAATGKETDHRVDEYSLGCILYEMLTGEVPFKGNNSAATLTKHVFDALIPPSRRKPELKIPPGIEALTLKAMAKKPDERYATMLEFLEAMDGAAAELVDDTPSRNPAGAAARSPQASMSRPTPEEDIPPAPRRSPVALAGIAAGAVVLLSVAGWFTFGHGTTKTGEPAAAPLAEVPAPAPSAPAPPAPAPPPADVTLRLGSVPAGAAVYEGSERLGVTPLLFQHPRTSEPRKLVFKLGGYKEVVHEIVPDQDREVVIALNRSRNHSPSHGSSGRRSRSSSSASDLRDPFK